MNSLSITLKPVDAGDGTCYKSIQLSIDGSRLQDMAREYELPFAKREGHPDIVRVSTVIEGDVIKIIEGLV